jgi:uncharacterized protein YcfL
LKNAFKLGFVALAVSLTVVACSSNQQVEDNDTTVVDSTIVTDTVAIPVDTAAVDTAVAQ